MAATQKLRWWKMILLAVAGLVFCLVAIVTVVVEREADYTMQSLGGDGLLTDQDLVDVVRREHADGVAADQLARYAVVAP